MSLTTERQTYLLRLRRVGHSIAEIAEMMDMTTSSISSCLSGAYQKLHAEHEAIEARELELQRLDEVQKVFYEGAIGGDHKAAAVVFSAMDRRAKILGLDAPEKKTVQAQLSIGWLGDEEPKTINGETVESGDEGGGDAITDGSEKQILDSGNDEGSKKLAGVIIDS